MEKTVTITLMVQSKGDYDETTCYCIDTNDVVLFNERLVDDFKSPTPSLDFDQAVTVLKKKEFRKAVLRKNVDLLVARMIEHIEDSEGWNGEDRRERCKNLNNNG